MQPMTIKWNARASLLALVLLAALPLQAANVAGVEVPETESVAGQQLALSSCGVRDTLWIDHYVAALYLPAGVPPASAMRDPAQPKAIVLQIVSERLLPEQIPQRWRKALSHELANDPLARVRAAYRGLTAGDRVAVRYAPQRGVSMAVNDRVIAHDEGHGVFQQMLSAWAEGDPISGKLQRLMLENPC